MSDDKFESWAVVEIFGHSRFAGKVTEQTIGGCAFVRIDVPELPADGHHETQLAFTKLFTQGAIFSITPSTEKMARWAASQFRSAALTMVDIGTPRRIARGRDDDEGDDDDQRGDNFGLDYLERTR